MNFNSATCCICGEKSTHVARIRNGPLKDYCAACCKRVCAQVLDKHLLAGSFWRSFTNSMLQAFPWAGACVLLMAFWRTWRDWEVAPRWFLFLMGHIAGVWSAILSYQAGGVFGRRMNRRKQPKP